MIYNADDNRFSFVPVTCLTDPLKLWELFLIQRKVDAFKKAVNPVKYLFIEPYRACNLQCTYCYAKEPGTNHVNMDLVQHLLRSRQFEEVLIFGGEPFLDGGDFVREILGMIGDSRLAVSTNGLNVDQRIIDEVKYMKNRFSLQVSIEPTQWTTREDSKGMHQNILLGSNRFKGIPIYFRVTIPVAGLYVPLKDVIADIADIKGDWNFTITYWVENGDELNYTVVKRWIQESEDLFNSEEREKYANKLIWSWWVDRILNMFNNREYFSYTNCNAAIESMAVGPDSRIYGCHEKAIIEDDAHAMALVDDRFRLTKQYIDSFSVLGCMDCRIRYFCGGVCFVQAHGGVCDFLKEMFEPFLKNMDWYFGRNLSTFLLHSKDFNRKYVNMLDTTQLSSLFDFIDGKLSLVQDMSIARKIVRKGA